MSKFHIHANRELRDKTGKPMKFYSEKDYTSELKKRGLEPFRKVPSKSSAPPYALDAQSREMIHQAAEYQRSKRQPGSRFIEALNKVGVLSTPEHIRNQKKGGFYNSNQ